MVGALYVLDYSIKTIIPYPVVGLPQTINANPNRVGWNGERYSTICGHSNTEKKGFSICDHISNGVVTISPKRRLSTFKNKNSYTHPVEGLKDLFNLIKSEQIRGSPLPERAVNTFKVTPVGNLKAS
jgi:hypothetical protein